MMEQVETWLYPWAACVKGQWMTFTVAYEFNTPVRRLYQHWDDHACVLMQCPEGMRLFNELPEWQQERLLARVRAGAKP